MMNTSSHPPSPPYWRKNGFSARFFTCPLEALAAARSKTPDLPIPELTIPEPSGIDLALQTKEQNPDREVLLNSGHPGRLLISKPPHPSESLSEIRKASWTAPRPEVQILEYLTHRSSQGPPDQHHSSSCFDEDHTPVWAYWYKDLGADVRQDPFVRARALVEMPSGRSILHTGQVLSNIALDLEIEGHRIRLEGVEMTVIATIGTPDLHAPLTEPAYSPLPVFVD
jgi:hypothetical protein